jgi:Ribosomal protein L7/L12 C-terminal domain
VEIALVVMALALLVLAWSLVFRGRDEAERTGPRLAAIERKLQLVMDHLRIAEPQPAMPDVVNHLDAGNKIQAIKAYRDATGAGLKEAKDAVEEMARRRGL